MSYKTSIKTFIFSSLLIIAFTSCEKETNANTDINQFIPSNSAVIIQVKELKSFLLEIDSLTLLRENEFLLPHELKQHLTHFSKYTYSGSSLISLGKINNGPLHFTFLSSEHPDSLDIKNVKNKSLETISIGDYQIKKYQIEDFTTYVTYLDHVFIASNSRDQLQFVIDGQTDALPARDSFNRARAAADPNKNAIFLNHTFIDELYKNAFPAGRLPLSALAEWSLIETDIKNNNLVLNGISIAGEEANKLLGVFDKVGTSPNELARIVPTEAAGFYSISYQSFDALHNNLNNYRNTALALSENHLLNYTGEAGMIFLRDKNYFVMKATDPDLAREILIPIQAISKEIRGIPVYSSENLPDFSEILTPLFSPGDKKYFAWLENFLVFAEDPEALEPIISNFLNKATLWEQEFYTEATKSLAGASSLLMVGNSLYFKSVLEKSASEEYSEDIARLDLKSYPLFALQFVQNSGFAHLHGIFSTAKNGTKNNVQQLALINLETDSGTPPFLVKNHLNKSIAVAVQDTENVLYLFSSEGSQLWKKQLPSRITGDIHQVDLFKNGNLQLAFTTLNTLQVLDRDGNTVKPFPLEFKDEITRPLSVFDYDNNSNYRFVITQKNNLLMFDPKGKPVRGFGFDKAASEIVQAPKHIRFNNKDYIVFPEANGKLNILSRQGKSRISVKGQINFSENHWYAYKNKFVSATSEGELIYVDESGNTRKESALPNLSIAANGETLVSLSENILKINEKQITLDYGLYSSPLIYNSNNKTYISITDIQARRLYVFDQDANLLEGFPVYGSAKAAMNFARNGKAFISVPEEEGGILLYTF